MKTGLLVLVISSVVLPIKASAQYQYYFSDSFTNGINTSNWYQNGAASQIPPPVSHRPGPSI